MAELTPAVAESILVAWLFALGACVGSFLNVVVYRLPAGKSLVFPGSHCPACAHPIRWHDNVPILSWLFLRGRCRDCAAQISLRYPAVEAITAALFVLVGVVEVVLSPLGIGQSAGIVTYHLLLLCTLLAGALIEYDGHRLPVRLFLPALVAGWLAPMVWPFLHPVSAWEGLNGPVAGFVDGPAGLGLGMLLGGALWWLPGTGRSRGLLLGPATVGLFLGWLAALVLTLAAAVFWWPTSAIRRLSSGPRTIPLIAWLALCALGWILAWGWLVSR
ncbi:MAG: hypothetical protein A2V98_25595 [Planctomycetes bacterium RBG_16_64_12]|nr:MAG: hypothetical protein A2V98_25595 [Planctomycetes bacterium RBG_16_64_12]